MLLLCIRARLVGQGFSPDCRKRPGNSGVLTPAGLQLKQGSWVPHPCAVFLAQGWEPSNLNQSRRPTLSQPQMLGAPGLKIKTCGTRSSWFSEVSEIQIPANELVMVEISKKKL